MLGLYYSTVYYVDDEDVAEAFQKLDRDHDGFITLEDTKTWPDLRIAFAKFDADHDGRLSRLDFDAFEHAVPGR
jgi:Ca2+-binding EF-hand superfamily protein